MNEPTIIGILAAGITGLATTVGVLFKMLQKHTDERIAGVEQKLDECEADRNDLWSALAKQAGADVASIRPKRDSRT